MKCFSLYSSHSCLFKTRRLTSPWAVRIRQCNSAALRQVTVDLPYKAPLIINCSSHRAWQNHKGMQPFISHPSFLCHLLPALSPSPCLHSFSLTSCFLSLFGFWLLLVRGWRCVGIYCIYMTASRTVWQNVMKSGTGIGEGVYFILRNLSVCLLNPLAPSTDQICTYISTTF